MNQQGGHSQPQLQQHQTQILHQTTHGSLSQPGSQEQHPQQSQQQQLDANRQDSISKVKQLYSQLYECLMETLRTAGVNISNNASIDQGIRNAGEISNVKFEETLEKFYSVYNQMELQLKTAIDHASQSNAAHRYAPSIINPTVGENQKYAHLNYVTRNQVNYVKDLHNELVNATANISNSQVTRSTDHIATMDP